MSNTWIKTAGSRVALCMLFVAFAGCAHQAVVRRPGVAGPTVVLVVPPELQALLAGNTLHFDYDASRLDKQNREHLIHIGDYMLAHPEASVRISGHCDERGTEEYNLALGQRRADVAREYLTNLGIDERRIAVVSYGKNMPTSDDHDERAWAENRRDEFEAGGDRPSVVALTEDAALP